MIEDHFLIQFSQGMVHRRSTQNLARFAQRGYERLHFRMRVVAVRRKRAWSTQRRSAPSTVAHNDARRAPQRLRGPKWWRHRVRACRRFRRRGWAFAGCVSRSTRTQFSSPTVGSRIARADRFRSRATASRSERLTSQSSAAARPTASMIGGVPASNRAGGSA